MVMRLTIYYMKQYKKAYLKAKGYTEADWIPCPVCGKEAVDVHHIYGRVGDLLMDTSKMIHLCRDCHTKAHANEISKEQLIKLIK